MDSNDSHLCMIGLLHFCAWLLEALEDGATVLAEWEPIDSDDIGYDEIQAVEARFKAMCSGKSVDYVLPL